MFKTTGVIRRVDDLGRIVIHKEIRRKHHIEEGEPIEIGEDESTLLLRKYSHIRTFEGSSKKIVDSFYEITKLPVVVCDTFSIVYSKGCTDLTEKNISDDLYDFMKSKPENYMPVKIISNDDIKAGKIELVYSDGDVVGAILIPKNDISLSEGEEACLKLCAKTIGKLSE